MRVPNDGDFTTTGQRCASIQYFLVENIDKSCRKTTRVRKREKKERERRNLLHDAERWFFFVSSLQLISASAEDEDEAVEE